MRSARSLSLGARLNLALLVFLLLLGAATSAIVIYGFNRTQDDATARSQEALEEQGKLALQAVVGGASEQGGLQFEAVAEIGRRSARYVDSANRGSVAAPPPITFARSAAGVLYDPNPNRTSDLVVLNGSEADDPAVQDEVAFSAPLDSIFPVLLEGFAGEVGGENLDAIAIVFIGTNSTSRYYPPIGIHESLPASVDISSRMDAIGPINNPDRRTIWTAPYADSAGQGQIVTARTPVYDGDTFRGSLEVDLAIDGLIDQINAIKVTPNAFAFYVDSAGNLFQTDAFDLLNREAAGNAELAAALDRMKATETGSDAQVEKLNLENEDFYIAYAPMLGLGGTFAVAAPVSDITARASTITAGIEDEGTRTISLMLVAMGALFAVGLLAAGYLNRRVLVRPLQQLARATRAVESGDLTANVSMDRKDELGALADSFNSMVEQLRESERVLEQRVEDRTRELATLLEVSQNVASRIELDPLLESVLDQIRTVADYDRGALSVLEDGMLTVRAVREFGGALEYQPQTRVGMQFAMTPEAVGNQFESQDPVIINDVHADTPAARAYRKRLHGDVDRAAIPHGSYMAIPLIAQDTIVGLVSLSRDQTGFYTPDDARLTRAIASQVASAIVNARLFEEIQRRARETEALLRADDELLPARTVDEVLQVLADVAVDIMKADKCLLTLVETRVRASRNFSSEGLALIDEHVGEQHRSGAALDPKLFILNDVAEDPRLDMQPIWELEGIRSYMAVPFMNEVVGGFGVAYTSLHTFSSDEVRVFESLAKRGTIALQNARLIDETQRQARETEALLRADAELFQTLNLDRVLQALVDVAVDVLGVDKSVVMLHEGEVDVIRASRNFSRDGITSFNRVLSTMPHVEPLPGQERTIVYADIAKAPQFIAEMLTSEGVTSHLSVPVRGPQRMLGVFGVSYREQHAFTNDEQRLYGALADRAAVAIQNAELFETAQQAASLEERQRLARDLHDSVSQALYGIALGARTARLRLGDDPHNAAEPVDYVMTLAQAGLAEMRALIFELRPESLQEEGVVAAIEKHVASTRARYGLYIDADLGDEPDCGLDVKEALYRIAQEALHNVVKHAQAQRVEVKLARDGDALMLSVRDDGRGFDTSGPFPGHVGLHSMPERAAKLRGTVTIESGPGGTAVVARLPL